MTYLAVAAGVFLASVSFVLGFVVGAKFMGFYFKERGLLIEEPKQVVVSTKNPGSGGRK